MSTLTHAIELCRLPTYIHPALSTAYDGLVLPATAFGSGLIGKIFARSPKNTQIAERFKEIANNTYSSLVVTQHSARTKSLKPLKIDLIPSKKLWIANLGQNFSLSGTSVAVTEGIIESMVPSEEKDKHWKSWLSILDQLPNTPEAFPSHLLQMPPHAQLNLEESYNRYKDKHSEEEIRALLTVEIARGTNMHFLRNLASIGIITTAIYGAYAAWQWTINGTTPKQQLLTAGFDAAANYVRTNGVKQSLLDAISTGHKTYTLYNNVQAYMPIVSIASAAFTYLYSCADQRKMQLEADAQCVRTTSTLLGLNRILKKQLIKQALSSSPTPSIPSILSPIPDAQTRLHALNAQSAKSPSEILIAGKLSKPNRLFAICGVASVLFGMYYASQTVHQWLYPPTIQDMIKKNGADVAISVINVAQKQPETPPLVKEGLDVAQVILEGYRGQSTKSLTKEGLEFASEGIKTLKNQSFNSTYVNYALYAADFLVEVFQRKNKVKPS